MFDTARALDSRPHLPYSMRMDILKQIHAYFPETKVTEKIRVAAPGMFGSGFRRVDKDGSAWVFAAPGWWAGQGIKPDLSIYRGECDKHARVDEARRVFWEHVVPDGPSPSEIAVAILATTKAEQKRKAEKAAGVMEMF